jgi:hypothetical protein
LVHISHQNALLNNGHSNRRRCQNYSPLILSFIRRVLCWRGIKRTDEEWKRGGGGIVKCVSVSVCVRDSVRKRAHVSETERESERRGGCVYMYM